MADNLQSVENKDLEFQIHKCANCGSEYIHAVNPLNFCNVCLKNDLINNLMGNYLSFSTEALQLYLNGKESNIPLLLENCK